jgi:hypothetical protein
MGKNQVPAPAKQLTAVAINPQTPSIVLGNSVQLSATALFSDGSKIDVTSAATWTSAQPDVASINAAGMAVSKTIGATSISALYKSVSGSSTLTVAAPALVSIVVTPQNPSLTPNHSVQLSASGTFTDGITKDISSMVTWSSTATSVLTINATGLTTAKSPGAAIITASEGSISGSDTVTVASPTLVSIAVAPQNPALEINQTVQLSAGGTFSDGSTQDLSSAVIWSSTPSGIVITSSTGLATAKAPGAATVVAMNGSINGSDTLTVAPPTLVSIAVAPQNAALTIDQTVQLSARGKFSDGSTQDLSSAVAWSSTPSGIVITSGTGLVTAKSPGAANVTATSGSISGMAQMQVSDIVSLTVVPASSVLVLRGSEPLTALVTFADGSTQDITKSVSWSSSDPGIASVSNGVLYAWRVGSAIISASFGPVVGHATVAVKPVLAVSYFSNANMSGFADAAVRVNNPGLTGANLCAEIYVFDQDQQLSECCGCLVSPNGLRTLSVNTDLTGNPLTGVKSANGIIKIVPAYVPSNSLCDPTAIAPKGSLVAWSTHTQQQSTSFFAVTETTFQLGPLGDEELAALQSQCSFAATLGSGHGVCSCGTAASTPQ